MSDRAFTHDVFLSHSAKDKAVVRPLAERLRRDGLKVWFDEWELPSPAGAGEGGRRPGEGRGAKDIPAKIKEGPFKFGTRNSEFGIAWLCMSANAFGSDWAQLACPAVATLRRRKAGTFRFRDPLNQERRFIPLRLDDAPIKGSLAQFLYINYPTPDREQEPSNLRRFVPRANRGRKRGN